MFYYFLKNVRSRLILIAENVSLQLLDTLPVCRDFKYGECKRAACKYVHLLDGNLSTDNTCTFMEKETHKFEFFPYQITWK